MKKHKKIRSLLLFVVALPFVVAPADLNKHNLKAMKPTNAQLRQFITRYFNDDDLESFCFDYFPEIKQEFTRGMPFSQKAEMLIGYCQRRGLEANLLANLQQELPQLFASHFTTIATAPPVVVTKPRNPRQIFISHAHEDAELAQRLASDLKKDGWPVWIAPNSIQPGEKWVTAVNRALDESGIFILLLTPQAVQSRWVRSETEEKQWEKAARGTDGRKFPWGNDKPTPDLCNFGQNVGGTTPVGKYSPRGDSPYGCQEMSGNVWEWTKTLSLTYARFGR